MPGSKDPGDLLAIDQRWGPLPPNKTLFLGYAFLITIANPSDKLSGQQKSAVSSEEEEEGGESPGGKGTVRACVCGRWACCQIWLGVHEVLAENTGSAGWVSWGQSCLHGKN